MMDRKITLTFLLCSMFLITTGQIRDFLPKCGHSDIIDHNFYSLCYSEKHEQAHWILYEMNSDRTYGSVKRTNNFREDPDVLTGSATKNDYKGSGYDRGHMAPAADMSFDRLAMSESFYMSNMSPQHPSCNRGIWKKGEDQVRIWFEKYGNLIIITGPVLEDSLPAIGYNQVSVPRFYYKIAYRYEKETDKHYAVGMIIPNEKVNLELNEYLFSVDDVEIRTGINFFAEFDDIIENAMESTYSIDFWLLLK